MVTPYFKENSTLIEKGTPRQQARREVILSLISFIVFFISNNAEATEQFRTSEEIESIRNKQNIPNQYVDKLAIRQFIDTMVAHHNFNAEELRMLFEKAHYLEGVIKSFMLASSTPMRNWKNYRSRFLDATHINNGVDFWKKNCIALDYAEKKYGVPAEYIVAIIGIETTYGRFMGNFRVIDSLKTLGFSLNTENQNIHKIMFRKNLEDFLIWTRSSNIDPLNVLGSYAGAIGIPQFMPSSIVKYAVSFDGIHPSDLCNNMSDAILSVANYLNKNGWEYGRPVVWKILNNMENRKIAEAFANAKPIPQWPLRKLLLAGLLLNEPNLDMQIEKETRLTIIGLRTPGIPVHYILGLHNFHVLTRYNRSFFYAASVHELAQCILPKINFL